MADHADRSRGRQSLHQPIVSRQPARSEDLLQLLFGRPLGPERLVNLIGRQFEAPVLLLLQQRGTKRLNDAVAARALLIEPPKLGELAQRAAEVERRGGVAADIDADM